MQTTVFFNMNKKLIAGRNNTCKDEIQEINNTICHTRSCRLIDTMTGRWCLTKVSQLNRLKRLPQMNMHKDNMT